MVSCRSDDEGISRVYDDSPQDRGGLGVNVPLIVAGALATLAAAVHGVGGEVLVVRKLSPGTLPSSRFGGPGMTKAMIHVTWHITTVAFLTVGVALLVAGTVLDGDTARGIAVVGASAFTGFGAVALGLALYTQPPRALLRHPGPIAIASTAALAWWGAL
jgi:hypothetical protein